LVNIHVISVLLFGVCVKDVFKTIISEYNVLISVMFYGNLSVSAFGYSCIR